MNIPHLNSEQYAILDHTINRAAGGRYCGGSKDMDALVEMGYMESIGKPAWCDDEFFTFTQKGRITYRNHKASIKP